MAKDKFAALKQSKTAKEFVNDAALNESRVEKKEKPVVTNINLTAVPVDLLDSLKENKQIGTGESVVGFIKRATRKLAKEEGII